MPGVQERVGTGDTRSCFYNLSDAQWQLPCRASPLHSSCVKALENSYSRLLATNVFIKNWILKRFLHPHSGLYFGNCPSSYFNMRKDMASQIIKIAQHKKNLATGFPKENSWILNTSEEIVLVMLRKSKEVFSIYVLINVVLNLWKIITKPSSFLKKNIYMHFPQY